MNQKLIDPDKYDLVGTPPFKLKAKVGKNLQIIGTKESFGTIPEIIAVERVIGQKNLFRVRAFIPKKDTKKKK